MKSNPLTIYTGLTAIDAFASAAKIAADHWIKLTPRGPFTARDGRQFNTPPEELVKRFKADAVAVPVDLDHATVRKAASGEAAPALGWIEELQARPDGLYGRVAWLKEGERILGERTHRYISPALNADEHGRAVWLHSAALVAAPAISMPAVASANLKEKGPKAMDTKPLIDALQLPANADPTEILAAVLSLKNEVEASRSKDTTEAAFEGISVTLAAELRAAAHQRQTAKVDEAITLGAIPPSLREWCFDLVTADEAKFDNFCAKLGRPFAYLQQAAITPEQEANMRHRRSDLPVTLSSEGARIARNLGIDIKSLDMGTI